MALIKNLLTGGNSGLPPKVIESQQLAAIKAWQILEEYPKPSKRKEWDIYKNLRGVMLADEVGGGKTFEALAIISKALLQLKSNKKRFRVLIIAAPSIKSKWLWHAEKEGGCHSSSIICEIDKFINQTDITKSESTRIKRFYHSQEEIKSKKDWKSFTRSNYRKMQGVWLSSFQALPGTKNKNINSTFQYKKTFPENFFNIIVVDEAHALKSGSKDVEETSCVSGAAIRKIFAILNTEKTFNFKSKIKLILLTATPFQNNKTELIFLLSLLEKIDKRYDVNTFTGLIALGIEKLDKELKRLTSETINIESLKELKKNFDHNINLLLDLENEQQIFRPKELKSTNGLDDYMSDIMIRNPKKPLLIKPEPVFLNEQEKLQYLLLRNLVKDTDEEQQMFSTKLSQLVSSDKSFTKKGISKPLYNSIMRLFGGNLIFNLKYRKLLELIDGIHISGGKHVITIFISWIPTLEILQKKLAIIYGKKNVYVLKGEQK